MIPYCKLCVNILKAVFHRSSTCSNAALMFNTGQSHVHVGIIHVLTNHRLKTKPTLFNHLLVKQFSRGQQREHCLTSICLHQHFWNLGLFIWDRTLGACGSIFHLGLRAPKQAACRSLSSAPPPSTSPSNDFAVPWLSKKATLSHPQNLISQ